MSASESLTIAITQTHVRNDPVSFGSMMISFPFSSIGGVMSKTCKIIAMFVNNPASAKCLPGQILPVQVEDPRGSRNTVCA